MSALTASAYALESDRDRCTFELQAQLDAAVGQLAQYEAAELGLMVGPAGADDLVKPAGSGGSDVDAVRKAGRQQAAAGLADQGPGGGASSAGRGNRPIRALGLTSLSARCERLEAEKAELQRGWREAEGRLAQAAAEAESLRARLAAVGAPRRLVVERIAEAQGRAQEAEARVGALEVSWLTRLVGGMVGVVGGLLSLVPYSTT